MTAYSMEHTQDNCYPNTTVLVNKLGITEQSKLSFAEQRIVTGMYTQAETTVKFENVDFEFYKLLHKHLFEDIYEWAGTVRNINISKKGTVFCNASEIERVGKLKFQRLKELNFLKDLKRDLFLEELTELYNDLNFLHPFREGNGRTLRLFITLLVRNAGFDISFAKCDRDLLMIATIKAIQGDKTLLREVVEELVKSSISLSGENS